MFLRHTVCFYPCYPCIIFGGDLKYSAKAGQFALGLPWKALGCLLSVVIYIMTSYGNNNSVHNANNSNNDNTNDNNGYNSNNIYDIDFHNYVIKEEEEYLHPHLNSTICYHYCPHHHLFFILHNL